MLLAPHILNQATEVQKVQMCVFQWRPHPLHSPMLIQHTAAIKVVAFWARHLSVDKANRVALHSRFMVMSERCNTR